MSTDLGQPRIVAHSAAARNASAKWDQARGCFVYETACVCGWSAEWAQDEDRPASAHFGVHAAAERAALTAQQIAWYERTGHCGACGEPGVFCQCVKPCGCSALHEVGCGLDADPLDVFAVAVVDDNQGELFGGVGASTEGTGEPNG